MNGADATLLTLLAASSAALLACAAYCRHARRLRRTRAAAEAVRESVLRPLPGRLGSVRLCATQVPARSGPVVGGDFHEALHTPYGVRLLVGNVRAGGPFAVVTSTTLLRTFRAAAHEERTLAGVCARLEACATGRFGSPRGEPPYDATPGERCATAVLAELPYDEPELRLIHRGQSAPLTVHGRTVTVHAPAPPGPPLGLAHLVGAAPVTQTVDFRPGDRLLLYTDGFTQARERDGRYHDLAARARARGAESLEDMVGGLREDLLRHTGGRPAAGAALVAVEERGLPGSGSSVR
ncbi:PP2C family protein-serine/threonine phosphatase [Streptomyces sp. NPDC086787]|uniref:PP2C family protein-serine/threonine phosphatase n=1 Tax=Streptomyces sp. NPDC086787 TaxID=3365759 RepID=UPI00381AA01E